MTSAPSFERIIREAAVHFGVTEDDILGPSRHSRLIKPRFVAMWLARDITKASYPTLGLVFRRSHSPVFKAIRRCSEWIDSDHVAVTIAIATITRKLNPLPEPHWPDATIVWARISYPHDGCGREAA